MAIFVIALYHKNLSEGLLRSYKPGYRSRHYSRGRKVRTAQSNAPVNSRVPDSKRQETESATENNCPPQVDEGENVR